MTRIAIIALLLVLTLLAWCSSPSIGMSSENPEKTSETTSTRITPNCDTFGTGGIAPLAETNDAVTTASQANRILRSTISARSNHPFNASDFEYVPRANVDSTGAVRDELDMQSTNTTLYYFSPDGDTRLDDMVIVTESGDVLAVHIGAC